MTPYLTADQLHILANAFKTSGFVPASKLYSRAHIKAKDVQQLYDMGLLVKREGKYGKSARTGAALEEHGFDTATLEIAPPAPVAPQEAPAEALADLLQATAFAAPLKDAKSILTFELEYAREQARNGNPFMLIKLQWPDLVIKDPIDLYFFKKHCQRTEHLDLRLDDKQCHFISQVFNRQNKEVAIKGCTSPGKGFATALCINVWYDIWDQDRIILISPTVEHAKTIMFAEVSKIRRRMKHVSPKVGVFTESIKDSGCESHILQILNPDGGEGISGAHGKNTLYVFDESSSIPNELIENARSPARLIIAISNPRTLSGWFYDLYPKVDPDADRCFVDRGIPRAVVTFGGSDCINVKARRLNDPSYAPPGGIQIELLNGTFEVVPEGVPIPKHLVPYVRALIPAQLDIAKYRAFKQIKDLNEVAWRVDGKFPPEDLEYQVIPPSWLSKPVELWKKEWESIEVTAFGLDLAQSTDGDSTILMAGGWKGIKHIMETKKNTTIETLNWLRTCAAQLGVDLFSGEAPIAVDAIGAGGARFCETLEEAGCNVIRCVGNAASDINPYLYLNKRAELYGELGHRLSPESDHLDPFMIPDDAKLHEEFAAHEKIFDTTGNKFRLTPKSPNSKDRDSGVRLQTVKEKIGRSPDRSDAAVLCYAAIRESAEVGKCFEQFDPSKLAISRIQTTGGATVYITAAGTETTEEMEVVDLEAEQRLWQDALCNVSTTGMF